jgi:glycosyltransferase involved in cell wall biosynthesis
MRAFAPEVHVVPNACDLEGAATPVSTDRPRELRGLPGPIVGYVGNLSSRIDIDLVEAIARLRPQWQFVFIGSAHIDRDILRLDALPNVHFLGVKPYERTRELVRHFDVGIIPHLDNEMTRSMNPLKAYVYCAGGVPVVSTAIDNLDAIADLVTVAHTRDEFVDAIEQALRAGRRPPDLDALAPHAWPARVDDVMRLIDAALAP